MSETCAMGRSALDFEHHQSPNGVQDVMFEIAPSSSSMHARRNDLRAAGVAELVRYLLDNAMPLRNLDLGSARVNVAWETVLLYAAQCSTLRFLDLHSNRIHFRSPSEDGKKFALDVNRSSLASLVLSDNNLGDGGTEALFQHLDSSTLRNLDLSRCRLPPTAVACVCEYLRSPRSHGLQRIDFTGNDLSTNCANEILAAAGHNVTIQDLHLERADLHSGRSEWANVLRRCRVLNERNLDLTVRTRLAALACLAPTRVLLCSSPAAALPPGSISPPRLPQDILELIARYTTGDFGALSGHQWHTMREYATDRTTLARSDPCLAPGRHQFFRNSWEMGDDEWAEEVWLRNRGCLFWENGP